MTDARPSIGEEDELLAAELAFGLLDAPERAAAERRLMVDPGFAAAHRRWQDRAAGLFVDADVDPPAGLWDAILTRLPANDAGSAGLGEAGRVRRWQAASAAAAALALVSTAALLTRPASRPAPPPRPAPTPAPTARPAPLIAMLASPERPAALAVGYDPASRRLTVLPSRLSLGERAAELWVIPTGGTPHALGVVAAGGQSMRTASPALAALLVPGATLAVSVEPVGGSPTGQPTGPVILTGPLAAG